MVTSTSDRSHVETSTLPSNVPTFKSGSGYGEALFDGVDIPRLAGRDVHASGMPKDTKAAGSASTAALCRR